jgi:hypothetical protein
VKHYTETPILILIFNRPDKVRLLIERLRTFKPKHIYISADGPRAHKPEEVALCAEARKEATAIDWPCEIHTHFSDINNGCKNGVAAGITWFFKQVDAGIILEDDCLPTESFLHFTTTMLHTYKDDAQVMHINGTSFLPATGYTVNEPYFFSRIAHSWGWATWRRAWKKFDSDMNDIDSLESLLKNNHVFLKSEHSSFWVKHFKHIKSKKVDSWANPWVYSILKNNGICITPQVNLIDNIGFDCEATHTKDKPDFLASTETLTLVPEKASEPVVNRDIDAKVMERVFKKSLKHRVSSLLKEWYYCITHR